MRECIRSEAHHRYSWEWHYWQCEWPAGILYKLSVTVDRIMTGSHLSSKLGERNWREDEWRGEFDQSDSILFVCQQRENFSSSNSIIVYISMNPTLNFPPLTGTHDATRKANLPWAVHLAKVLREIQVAGVHSVITAKGTGRMEAFTRSFELDDNTVLISWETLQVTQWKAVL